VAELRSDVIRAFEVSRDLAFAIDASTYPRPEAGCSPDREFHHHSCAGFHGRDGAAIARWAFRWLAQLSFAHDSALRRVLEQLRHRFGTHKVPSAASMSALREFSNAGV